MPASILVLDNYDSFTFNLVHYLVELGATVAVHRSDEIAAGEAIASGAQGVLISPGPGRPEHAGNSIELVAACVAERLPLLGVCLGQQAIAAHFGGTIVRAPSPVHGKTAPIRHDKTGVFASLPDPFEATRYHSLVIQPDSMPAALTVNAWTDDGTIQGIRHRELPIHGVQFHPESAATQHGHALLRNFLDVVRGWRTRQGFNNSINSMGSEG